MNINFNDINIPKPYIPEELPINLDGILLNREMFNLITTASNEMGIYKGFLSNTPNPILLISPLLIQEAVLSSKIEGTHATLEDFLNYEAGNKTEIEKDELHEISNYRAALFYALDNMATRGTINDSEKFPLTIRLIKEMHKILLNNVRGSSKDPGNFKRLQNYISSGSTISFTPVSPELTDKFMGNLENYIHFDEIQILVQSAIIHAQFEMIHPFQDGNGRIGRLLIPLFLYYKEYLPYPTFYMSSYFEANRKDYIINLSNISKNKDWKNWIEFYLKGIIEQAKLNTSKAQYLLGIYNNMKENIITNINSKNGINILDFIFQHPVFKAKQLSEKLNIQNRTVYNLLNQFVELGILSKLSEKKNITFYSKDILGISNA
ncbi:Fic family protein [Leptotrichia wadei]|jgi:conserved domain protein|uniref:Fic family protein n=1 Tax=Leptotrichia wadei TaxID=157687 RepID=UPI002065FCCB|nr:Fic family protein [Leptotrichia wadei]DAN01315.1 MAG TPA: Fic family protein [Caudoviricetes sp.]